MKRCYYRGLQSVEQQAQIRAGITAKKAEFVLNTDNINVTEINIIGGTNVVTFDILTDFELDWIMIFVVS
jgi:hypothetical protein